MLWIGSLLALHETEGPFHLEETDANFTIDWKGHYRIEGSAFVFVDRVTRQTRSFLGYPTRKLETIGRLWPRGQPRLLKGLR
jgi:hypothetical protein